MRQLIIAVWLAIISSVSAAQEPIRGLLIWTADRQTLTACDTGKVYWIRVLASNPHHNLSVAVNDLSMKKHGNIVAQMHGDIIEGKPSSGPAYNVDATLMVSGIDAVAHGDCPIR